MELLQRLMPPAERQKKTCLKKCSNTVTAPWRSLMPLVTPPPAETQPKKELFEEKVQHSTLGARVAPNASSRNTKKELLDSVRRHAATQHLGSRCWRCFSHPRRLQQKNQKRNCWKNAATQHVWRNAATRHLGSPRWRCFSRLQQKHKKRIVRWVCFKNWLPQKSHPPVEPGRPEKLPRVTFFWAYGAPPFWDTPR